MTVICWSDILQADIGIACEFGNVRRSDGAVRSKVVDLRESVELLVVGST